MWVIMFSSTSQSGLGNPGVGIGILTYCLSVNHTYKEKLNSYKNLFNDILNTFDHLDMFKQLIKVS